jgi:phosphoadenosine phosphosulfate reductase
MIATIAHEPHMKQKTKSPVTPVELDLDEVNTLLESLSAVERIGWAVRTFGPGLFAMTSAGVDSALMLDHIAEKNIPVIHINTGFLPKETLIFRDELQDRYGFQLHEYKPSVERLGDIVAGKLWETDLSTYSRMTKLEPLAEAIRDLGVTALLAGLRGGQTTNRSKLGYIGRGHDGEYRIHPFIDWSEDEVSAYFDRHKLPRHPLYARGFGSVGDMQTTAPGKQREGRTVMECGLHVSGGDIVRG